MTATTYPEHDRLYPSSRFNVIYEFFDFLTEQGVTDLRWEEVQDLVLTWQGINVAAYHAESAVMKVDFAWMWQQFGLPLDEVAPPKLRVTRVVADPDVEEVVVQGSAMDILMARLRQDRDRE